MASDDDDTFEDWPRIVAGDDAVWSELLSQFREIIGGHCASQKITRITRGVVDQDDLLSLTCVKLWRQLLNPQPPKKSSIKEQFVGLFRLECKVVEKHEREVRARLGQTVTASTVHDIEEISKADTNYQKKLRLDLNDLTSIAAKEIEKLQLSADPSLVFSFFVRNRTAKEIAEILDMPIEQVNADIEDLQRIVQDVESLAPSRLTKRFEDKLIQALELKAKEKRRRSNLALSINITAPKPPIETDEVDCTAFGPPIVTRGGSFLLQVYAHLREHHEEARQLAQEFDVNAVRRGKLAIAPRVERGEPIRFDLHIAGAILRFAEPSSDLARGYGLCRLHGDDPRGQQVR